MRLLLIPGLAGSCAALANAASAMFPAFTLAPFDHQIAGTALGIEDLADRAATHLPPDEPAYVCGESFGGMVALTLARRYPGRVRGLILLSTFARHPSADRIHARAVVALWSAFVGHAPPLARAARIVGMPSQFGRLVAPATAWTYLCEPLMPAAEYREKLRLIAAFDARLWLHEIASPSIVVLGRRDTVVPTRAGRELARLLPNATVCELDCGHLAYLAMPDRVRDAVDRWRAADGTQATHHGLM